MPGGINLFETFQRHPLTASNVRKAIPTADTKQAGSHVGLTPSKRFVTANPA
jgi:hypothetical protein